MANAWVVRPKPHGINRLDEFLDQDIVAIGWNSVGDLSEATEAEIRSRIEDAYDWSVYKEGQAVGQVNRFANEISKGDHILVPSGGDVYIGQVTSEYRWEPSQEAGKGYPHQRDVEWQFDGGAVSRSSLPGRIHDSLKGRLTVFSVDGDRVADLVESELVVRERDRFGELQQEYLERLQDGAIPGINANSFEGAVVKTVLDNYFPSISREATTSDESGDTDLLAELPGDVTIRVQVKHFYPDRGELGAGAVEQLAASMTPGDHGIVVTSTSVSEGAEAAAAASDHHIGIIDGEEFTELLFEDLQNYTEQELNQLGLEIQPPAIKPA
ncbi:restriction endonuclease [Haloglomus halophilum]|uniref:restriction endonuclease n=1 Tax=Haloglomus halophilum TaxID=2962672 RepID=UPI0020C951D9|nr:restriction endonuclease [Haloglomus halophilum]